MLSRNTSLLIKKMMFIPIFLLIMVFVFFYGCSSPDGDSPDPTAEPSGEASPEPTAQSTPTPTTSPTPMVPPEAPVVTGPELTNNQQPTWTWNAVPGAVNYRHSFSEVEPIDWTETTDTFYTPETPLEDGSYTLYVQAGNAAGWSGSGEWEIEIDTELPDPPEIVWIGTEPDSGQSYNITLSFTLTLDAEATEASYSLNNGTDWITYTVQVDIADEGDYQVVARQVVDGKTSPSTFPGIDFTIDKTAPDPPEGLDLATDDDKGWYPDDNETSQTENLTISGTSEANAGIDVYSDLDGSLGNTDADGDGNWTIDITLTTEDVHNITATATDAATNVSGASDPLVITIDVTPAGIPADLDLAAEDDSGNSNSDNITKNTSGLTISGTSDADIRVSLSSDKTGALDTTTADGSGNWTMNVSLTENLHSITARSIDPAGNVSGPSDALVITVDTTGNAPTGLDLAADDDTGSSDTDENTSQDSNLTISGTSEADAAVYLWSDIDADLGSTTANGSGNWSMDIALTPDNVHSVTATIEDVAGNTSGESSALEITVDQTAPNPPAGLDLATEDDHGTSGLDNITNQTTALTISGTSEAYATVALTSTIDGDLGDAAANGSGNWTKDITLSVNTHSITATQDDLAGNSSGSSASLTIEIDTTPPGTPSVPDLDSGDDSGSLNTDNITKNTTDLGFTGTAEANISVTLLSDLDGTLASGTATGGGAYSFDPVTITSQNNTHSITAQAMDTAGNTADSGPLALVIDTTDPSVLLKFSDVDRIVVIDASDSTNFTSESNISSSWESGIKVVTLEDLAGNTTIMSQAVYQGPDTDGLQTAVETDGALNEIVFICAGTYIMNDRLDPLYSMTLRGDGSATTLTTSNTSRRTIHLTVTGLTVYIEYLKIDSSAGNREPIFSTLANTIYVRDITKGATPTVNLVSIVPGVAYYWNGSGYSTAQNGVDGWVVGATITFMGAADTRYWY